MQPHTDPAPTNTNQYRLLLTQFYHVSTSSALYWPSNIIYQPVLPHTDPVLSCINQNRAIVTITTSATFTFDPVHDGLKILENLDYSGKTCFTIEVGKVESSARSMLPIRSARSARPLEFNNFPSPLLGNNDHCCSGLMITASWDRQSLVSWSAHHLKFTSSLKTWRAAIDTWKEEKNYNLSFFGLTVLLIINFALKINDEYCDVWGIFQKCSGRLSLPCKPVDSPHKLIRARQLWLLTSPAGTKVLRLIGIVLLHLVYS